MSQYVLPPAFPSIDQLQFITPALIQAPFVQDAWKTVQQLVDPQVLAIAPSTYVPLRPANPVYNADPVANCYWPAGTTRCVQPSNPKIQPDIYVCSGQNQWGLTYDDGPYSNIVNGQHVDDSTAVQQALDQQNIKATFFVVGSNVIQHPEVVKQHYDSGHQIALHTWTHHPMTSLTNEQIVAEIKYNEAIVYQIIGKIPRFFRPPYGDIDDRVRAIAQALGYQAVLWTSVPPRDSGDTAQPDQSIQSVNNVVGNVTAWFSQSGPGFISLQHDINNFTSRIDLLTLANFATSQSPLKPMPIGTCINQPFYREAGSNPQTTLASVPTGVPSNGAYQVFTWLCLFIALFN
ncbi:hypothetical protein EDD86DRAFT_229137 [Gorgonomyces haynaldii]|nr:hypothetical protein EDD86DRAFT_229137 [Gorgonomyces haynaldii]